MRSCRGFCSGRPRASLPPGRLSLWRRRRLNTDRKSTRLNSSHDQISYAVFCLKKNYNNVLTTRFIPVVPLIAPVQRTSAVEVWHAFTNASDGGAPAGALMFFFNDTATTEIYTLSLHDALPIYPRYRRGVLAREVARRSALREQ